MVLVWCAKIVPSFLMPFKEQFGFVEFACVMGANVLDVVPSLPY
jgi:hypothetical protein